MIKQEILDKYKENIKGFSYEGLLDELRDWVNYSIEDGEENWRVPWLFQEMENRYRMVDETNIFLKEIAERIK